MPHELISVLIPVLNGENFIARTLASVLDQTYQEIEVIVVDDGSTDRTREIVEAFARTDRRVKLFSGPHAGVARARNTAIERASGTLIAPVDADDIWHRQKLELQVAAMRRASSSVGVAYCLSAEIDEIDRIIRQPGDQPLPEGKVLVPMIESNFLGNASTPLMRRSLVARVGGYDPSLRDANAQGAEDWKLYLALAEICQFVFVPACLVGYRKFSGSMSSNVETMARSISLVREWSEQRWPNIPRRHWRRQNYFMGNYLAHQAVVGDRFAEAMLYW
ncbi:MAG: glycosyltransferase family 2 protein, partial [Blastocatellia bacterium]|nr:glycosyltransferase family 2 protein [Blastocatellia bacterium]